MEILLAIFFCVRNYMRARAKRLSGGQWAFFTFLAMLGGWFVGSFIMVIILLIRFPELRVLASQPGTTPADVSNALVGRINMFTAEIFLLFCGLGGYLLVRHLLIRKPDVPGKREGEE